MATGSDTEVFTARSETFPYAERSFRYGATKVAYFDGGAGQTAIVFVHGLGSNMTHFEYIAPPLEALGFRVCGLDLPSFGHSGRRRGTIRVAWLSGALAALLDRLALRSAIFLGHSLGGMIAADLALRAPSRVRALIMLSPGGLFRFPPQLATLFGSLMIPTLVAPLLESGARAILRFVFAQENERTRLFAERTVGRYDPTYCPDMARTMWLARKDLTTYHLLDAGPRLAMPVLVLWGEHDRLLPFSQVEAWMPTLPDGRLEVLRGCGHLAMIEDPAAVLGPTERFLRAKVAEGFGG